jgi:indole-3-glycerol phosphate synthase
MHYCFLLFSFGPLAPQVGDVKRMSPTAPNLPRVVSTFTDAGRRADELFGYGVNVCMVNTDGPGWGGAHEDLEAAVATQKRRRTAQQQAEVDYLAAAPEAATATPAEWAAHTAVVCKDLIIHPLQVAAAVERGADGVLLTVTV